MGQAQLFLHVLGNLLLLVALGEDCRGRDAVDADTERTSLQGECFGQRFDTRFGARVCDGRLCGGPPGHGGSQVPMAPWPLIHPRQKRLESEKRGLRWASTVCRQPVSQRSSTGPERTGPPAPIMTVYGVQATLGDGVPARIQAARERECTFALITTRPAADYDVRRLLEEYEGPTAIEQRFHVLKDSAFVDALLGQKPERVEALGYVPWLACLVLNWLERRVRQGPLVPTPARGALARPTGHAILHPLRRLIVTPVDATSRQLFIPAIFAAPVTPILAAAGFTEAISALVPRRHTS